MEDFVYLIEVHEVSWKMLHSGLKCYRLDDVTVIALLRLILGFHSNGSLYHTMALFISCTLLLGICLAYQ